MNAKHLKELRRLARSTGLLRERSLSMPKGMNVRMVPDFSQVNPDGTQRMVPFAYTGTLVNDIGTQRSFYRALKAR